MSINNPTLDELLSSPIGSTNRSANTSRISYIQEIQHMMYVFGDYERPLYESAQLVEHVVHQQMSALLWHALAVAQTRGSRDIGLEEILFLMRFNRSKLRRLVKHLRVNDEKSCFKIGGTIHDIDSDTNPSAVGDMDSNDDLTPKPPQQTKRVKLCYDFLSSIDSLGNFLVVFDDTFVDAVTHQRNVRSDTLSRNMSEADYMKYSECRKVSFANKSRPSKFKDWLLKDIQLDLKPNALALEVLQYLAKETVSQVVDLALLVKQDLERDVCDPLASLLPQKMVNNDFPITHSSETPIGGDSDDLLSNHCSQNTPFFMSSQSKCGTNSMTNGTDGQKWKKRKRCDPSKLEFEAHSYCITPDHIREALRRYFIPSGPFAKSNHSFNQSMNHNTKLLCL